MSIAAVDNKMIQALAKPAAKAASPLASLEKTFTAQTRNQQPKAPPSIKNRNTDASNVFSSVSSIYSGVLLEQFRKAANEWKPKVSSELFAALNK